MERGVQLNLTLMLFEQEGVARVGECTRTKPYARCTACLGSCRGATCGKHAHEGLEQAITRRQALHYVEHFVLHHAVCCHNASMRNEA